MTLRWEQIVADAHDPATLGAWWAAVLGWTVVNADPQEYEIQPSPGMTPGMIFESVPEPKSVKNRLHVDLRPDDQEAEVVRLLDMGATKADLGELVVPWVVLNDPEGNEFCVLGNRPSA